jgi:hypothetical protein
MSSLSCNCPLHFPRYWHDLAHDFAPSRPQRPLCALTYKAPTLLSLLSLFRHLNRQGWGIYSLEFAIAAGKIFEIQ